MLSILGGGIATLLAAAVALWYRAELERARAECNRLVHELQDTQFQALEAERQVMRLNSSLAYAQRRLDEAEDKLEELGDPDTLRARANRLLVH